MILFLPETFKQEKLPDSLADIKEQKKWYESHNIDVIDNLFEAIKAKSDRQMLFNCIIMGCNKIIICWQNKWINKQNNIPTIFQFYLRIDRHNLFTRTHSGKKLGFLNE